MAVLTLKLFTPLFVTLLGSQTGLGLLVPSHIALLRDHLITVLTCRHLLLNHYVLSRIFDLGLCFSVSGRDLRSGFYFLDLGLGRYLTRGMKN